MIRRVTRGMPKTIDRLAVDALLYGVARSLDYLGEQRVTILSRMGELMLEYLVDAGQVEPPDRPKEFARSLERLLTKNGFDSRAALQFKGSPPALSVQDFVEHTEPRKIRRVRSGITPPKVDWVLYEMVLYGMTKALDDQLGAQAQLILNHVGTKMVDYLVEAQAVEPSKNPFIFVERLKAFYMAAGLAKSTKFDVEGSPPQALVATWTYAPYYTNVFRRLRNEGSALFSCPVCLACESVLAKSQGVRFRNMVELRFLPGAKVFYRHKIIPPTERFTEEDARKISEMAL